MKMVCDRCNLNPATVHLKTVLNGIVEEKHLCQKCAMETGQLQLINIQNPFSSIVETLMGLGEAKPSLSQRKCKSCQIDFGQFRRTGQLGCPSCYGEFYEELTPILRRIQGDITHHGKVPIRQGGRLSTERRIEKLRLRLGDLVKKERYEEAAKVRDEIKELEQKDTGGAANG